MELFITTVSDLNLSGQKSVLSLKKDDKVLIFYEKDMAELSLPMVEQLMNSEADKKIIQMKNSKEADVLYHIGQVLGKDEVNGIKICSKEDYMQNVQKFLKEDGWNCTIANSKPKGRPKTVKIEEMKEATESETPKKRGRKPGRKPKDSEKLDTITA